MRIMPDKFLVFTDLDGTLLDHSTYSFKAAEPALEMLRAKNIPLIICTSKTRAEIEHYRHLLDNHCPFISENGAAIYIPESCFTHVFDYDKYIDGYRVIEFGTERETLIKVLDSVSTETGIVIKGFSTMSEDEIAESTGLEAELAWLASEREYSEPFIISGGPNEYDQVGREIEKKGFRYTRGGRFHHILGMNDKGRAVDRLTGIYAREYGQAPASVALGDSLNDLPMLEKATLPILVQKQNGEYDGNIKLDNVIRAGGIGPEGWNVEILKLFMNNKVEPPENTGN